MSDAVRDRLTAEHAGREAEAADTRALAEAPLPDGRTVTVRRATGQDAALMVEVIHGAFRARPSVGERPAALSDTPDTIAAALRTGQGFLAEVEGRAVGCVLVTPDGAAVRLGRVSVLPDYRRFGIATFAIAVIMEALAVAGETYVTLLCRREFAEIRRWWERHGFVVAGVEGNCFVMERALAVVAEAPDAATMRSLGRRLAKIVRAGDLIVASGDLGAGKTTFTQGLGEGLQVAGPVISPTFVLSRVHPSTVGGPALVHVDAYRLSGFAELDDLDLDATLDSSVTLVEWGAGIAEPLSEARLDIDIRRSGDPQDEQRWLFVTPIGTRWSRAEIAAALKEDS